MLLLDTKIGRLEVVIEKHDTTANRWAGWDIPAAGELVLDFGKFSLMITNMKTRRQGWDGTTCGSIARRAALGFTAGLLLATSVSAALDVARDWTDIPGDQHPQ